MLNWEQDGARVEAKRPVMGREDDGMEMRGRKRTLGKVFG